MNAIAVAYEGQWEFMTEVLEAGGFIKRRDKPVEAEPLTTKAAGQTLTPALFKALFGNGSKR